MIPNDWDKIEPHVAIAIAPYVLQGKESVSAKLKILEALVPSEVLPLLANLKPEKVRLMFPDIEWVFSKPILKSHIESFVVHNISYFLPLEKFTNVNLIEFSYATKAYDDLCENKSPIALNKLIASLCRQQKIDVDTSNPDFDGDIRERFNPYYLDKRADAFNDLSSELKSYFLLFFDGCSSHIVKTFKPLFSKENTEGSDKPSTPNFGWLGTIMSLSDTHVFGNFEQTQYTNIYTALGYRLKKYYEEKELKKA
jgi:hypothetical protein